MSTASLTIHTIGHSNRTESEFVTALQRYQIRMVVDVRSAPFSRFSPHFNRDNLRHVLADAGIRYTFAGDKLGGRPDDPGCYRHGVIPPAGADYLQEVDYVAVEQRPWYQAGIARLIELAANEPVAVMCSEGNPEICHRHHLIARSLLNQGVMVRHILPDASVAIASVTPQQTDLFDALRGDA